MEVDSNLPQCSDKSVAWVNQPQGLMSQAGPRSQQVSDQSLAERHAVSSFQPPTPPNYQAGGLAQGSVLGFSPAPAEIATFASNAQQPWVAGQMVVPLESFAHASSRLQGYMNVTDAQGNNQISGGSRMASESTSNWSRHKAPRCFSC